MRRAASAARSDAELGDNRRLASRLTWGTLRGATPTDDELALIRDGLGGIVLFSRSIGDRAAVRELVTRLRAEAPGPLHVSVDQEGGHVVRLRNGFTAFPGAMAIGAARSSALAFAAARASGTEIASAGIDTVLAPVLDLAADLRNPTVGSRSYGADPALVSRLGAAAIRGYLAGGVLPVPKHFPGHGRTPLDSHLSSPVVGGDMAALRRDLRPFRAALDAGAPMLMASHVRYDAVGDNLPATLSEAVLELARSGLAFDGVVVSDAMVMDAITVESPVPEACLAALVAGCDVAMALEPARRTIDVIAAALADGRLPPRRAGAAARRLAALEMQAPSNELSDDDFARHRGLADEIARRSLTLAWDNGLLPLPATTSIALVDIAGRAMSPVEDRDAAPRSPVAAALASRFTRVNVVPVVPSRLADSDAAVQASFQAEVVVVATRDAFLGDAERRLLARLADVGRPVIRVAMHSPADLAIAPRPDAAIATYSEVAATTCALTDGLLRGPAAFPGRLPVTLPLEEPAPEAQAG
ncbi:MAG: glycoside hydrolase family 3 protein [Chloroflexota bacterium]